MSLAQVPDYLCMRTSFGGLGKYYVAFFALLGFLLSITQPLGQSPDYLDYANFFDLTRFEGSNIFGASRFEPGFSAITLVLTILFDSNIVVYSWIVATAILLKGWGIRACSSSQKVFIIAATFYLIRYFPLHELTQLRAALAIALIMVGSILLWRGYLLYGFLMCAMSLLFHMSSMAIIPALLLSSTKRWQVVAIALILFFLTATVLHYITGYLANFVLILDGYQRGGFGEEAPNPFSIQLLIDWAMIFVSLVKWSKLTSLMRRVVLLELIGMAIFYGGIEFAVIAHRIREFYSVFWVFFVIDGLQQKSTRLLSYSFVLASIVFYFYIFVLEGNFFQ
jgi:EpsG family